LGFLVWKQKHLATLLWSQPESSRLFATFSLAGILAANVGNQGSML
jgi:hypothetical protein